MTTPRQYADAPDPNLIPADQMRQPTEDFGEPAQQHSDPLRQHSDPAQQHGDPAQQHGDSAQRHGEPLQQHQVDPSAEQFSPPPAAAAPTAASTTTATSQESRSGEALFAEQDLSELRAQWNDVQAGFVDDPRECVQKADGLVSSTVEQLTASFSQTRSRLEEQWSRGEEASTEDLRIALKQYRDFFDRLLAV
ncbi:MAG: hypothetical protein ABWY45_21780 [Mycobacterium sp.]